MRVDDVRWSARYARDRLAPASTGFPAEQVRRELQGVLPPPLLEEWLERVSAFDIAGEAAVGPEEHVSARPGVERRESGLYMTPEPVAEGLAAAGELEPGDVVVDLAAGTGRLLEAVARRQSRVRLVAVERDPVLAVAAAVRLVARDEPLEVDVYCGDGLSAEGPWVAVEGEAAMVVLNPPYVGEKGRRELFDRLRGRHEHLAEWFGPRIDLAYLFVHRALDYLAEGGRLSLLSSAYWLSATGARGLRRDLSERARPVAFVRAPRRRLFDDAPGHHSLLSIFERTEPDASAPPPVCCTVDGAIEEWRSAVELLLEGEASGDALEEAVVTRPGEEVFVDSGWSPFASRRDREWAEQLRRRGTPLGDLLEDRQGFVSGADRVSRRRLNQIEGENADLEPGDPGFLMRSEEVPGELRRLEGTVVRPVLRGSELSADTIRVRPPETCRVLFLDEELGDNQDWVVDHLRPLRPALADRREVREGRMPWYRLHWPRDRAEQTGPKLVVPRRAERPRFALDLSASAISSDCTYLIAPESVRRPVRYLAMLMLLLNRPAAERYLRNFGKSKGEVLEFYADPLQSLPLPVRRRDGALEWIPEAVDRTERERIDARLERGLQELRTPEEGARALVSLR